MTACRVGGAHTAQDWQTLFAGSVVTLTLIFCEKMPMLGVTSM